jgi:hypothetical protein
LAWHTWWVGGQLLGLGWGRGRVIVGPEKPTCEGSLETIRVVVVKGGRVSIG